MSEKSHDDEFSRCSRRTRGSLASFSGKQLAQIFSPQDPSLVQIVFDFGIDVIAFEQHWLAPSFRLRHDSRESAASCDTRFRIHVESAATMSSMPECAGMLRAIVTNTT